MKIASNLALTVLVSSSALLGVQTVAHAAEDTGAMTLRARVNDLTTYRIDDDNNVKFSALIQGWAVGNDHSTVKDQNIRLRRSELKLGATVARDLKLVFMADPSRLIPPPGTLSPSADNMIQDVIVGYTVLPGLELSAGQFKIPTLAEGLDSSAELPLPERSLITRTLGDRREMGAKAAYRYNQFQVASMVSSGRSLSQKGERAFNDLDTRFEYAPTRDASLGTFVVAGNQFDYSKKGRWGLNGRYAYHDASFRAEYAHGKDGAVHTDGMTTEVGYNISENLQPVVRFEAYHPNQRSGQWAEAETIGVNYFMRASMTKLQLAASALHNLSAVNGSPALAAGQTNAEVTLAAQAAF
jgi:hypothetical protein